MMSVVDAFSRKEDRARALRLESERVRANASMEGRELTTSERATIIRHCIEIHAWDAAAAHVNKLMRTEARHDLALRQLDMQVSSCRSWFEISMLGAFAIAFILVMGVGAFLHLLHVQTPTAVYFLFLAAIPFGIYLNYKLPRYPWEQRRALTRILGGAMGLAVIVGTALSIFY